MLNSGIHEFIFGVAPEALDQQLAFWDALGFTPVATGALDEEDCETLYGHRARLTSHRLAHSGCAAFGTGHVRLQAWLPLCNAGLGKQPPLTTGSRWMGMYTRDILQIRDSLSAHQQSGAWDLWLSPLVAAPLANPAPDITLWQPFRGLRETLVFSEAFRLAFIQRGGFDRPGFGSFDDSQPYRNTEGSHANIVQPPNSFSTAFYKAVFGFETAPFGEAHVSGDDAATAAALALAQGERFDVERIRAPEVPTGLLQVYSSHRAGPDCRPLSRAGSGGLCLYSIKTPQPDKLRERVIQHGGERVSPIVDNEFGEPSLSFDAPDGYQWLATGGAD